MTSTRTATGTTTATSTWTTLSLFNRIPVLAGVASDRLATLSDLTHQYPEGVVLKLPRRRLVVISSPDQVKHVLVDNARGYAKGLGQAEATRWLGHGLLTAEGSRWHEQRGHVADLLTARRIHAVTSDLVDLATESASSLAQVGPTSIDPRRHVAQYTIDVLAHVLGIAAPKVEEIVDAFDGLQQQIMFDTTTQQLVPSWILPIRRLRAARHRKRLLNVAQRCLTASGGPPPALAGWTTPDRMLSLWLAGYETTAATLGWALWFLSERPELQEQLAVEAARELTAASPGHLPQLPVAQAVFRETVRLRPPVWLISRRALETDLIGPNRVRRGDDVVVCVHALHNAPPKEQSTPSVDDFDPHRVDPGRSLAFGQGSRACPGGALAELEATIWLASACSQLEFSRADATPPRPKAQMSQTPAHFLINVRHRQDRPSQQADRPEPVPQGKGVQ